jgi:hypothetical protein
MKNHAIETILRVLHGLRNALWYAFHVEFRKVVKRWTPEALGIAALYQRYEELFGLADMLMGQVSKSYFTGRIKAFDRARDECIRGIRYTVKALLKSSNPQKKDAAARMMILLDTYGDVTQKEYDAESAAIDNFLQELHGKYSEDVKILGIADWVDELDNYNRQFETFVDERYAEKAEKPVHKLVNVRTETDAAYGNLIKVIEAVMLTNPEHGLDDFAKELNVVIKHYKTIYAQEKGRKAAKKAPKEVPEIELKNE